MAKSDQPTTIKKHANRRLYNTGTSTYVTLEDLAAMVKEGEDFLVYDAKTGDDITRSVLAQISCRRNVVGKRFCPALFSCSKMICASTERVMSSPVLAS